MLMQDGGFVHGMGMSKITFLYGSSLSRNLYAIKIMVE